MLGIGKQGMMARRPAGGWHTCPAASREPLANCAAVTVRDSKLRLTDPTCRGARNILQIQIQIQIQGFSSRIQGLGFGVW